MCVKNHALFTGLTALCHILKKKLFQLYILLKANLRVCKIHVKKVVGTCWLIEAAEKRSVYHTSKFRYRLNSHTFVKSLPYVLLYLQTTSGCMAFPPIMLSKCSSLVDRESLKGCHEHCSMSHSSLRKAKYAAPREEKAREQRADPVKGLLVGCSMPVMLSPSSHATICYSPCLALA